MYYGNSLESTYVGIASMYKVRQYVVRPPKKVVNQRLNYGIQEHNHPAKYRWK